MLIKSLLNHIQTVVNHKNAQTNIASRFQWIYHTWHKYQKLIAQSTFIASD